LPIEAIKYFQTLPMTELTGARGLLVQPFGAIHFLNALFGQMLNIGIEAIHLRADIAEFLALKALQTSIHLLQLIG